MTDRERDRIEAAIRHIQTAVDVDPWAVDIAVAAMEKQISSSRDHENDPISRQAAIDAINEQIEQCDTALSSFDISMIDAYAVKVERASLVAYKEQLEFLPSVQPDHDRIWEALSKLYNMDGVSDEAKAIIGDVMLELDGEAE